MSGLSRTFFIFVMLVSLPVQQGLSYQRHPSGLFHQPDPVLQEEIVDKITRSIRQTAATGSHFSKMLSPEEEEIMREIIREFMKE